ncbi:hypothetical protein IKL64_05705 [bacterium]|nr:hypothetical protein [bacterium]
MDFRNVNYAQNNNPAFGMAVLKPVKPEDAARFVTDITKDVYFSPKQVDKAVTKIMARAAKNTQFDILPFVDRLVVDGKYKDVVIYRLMPKTDDARRIMKEQGMSEIISTRYYNPAEALEQRVFERLECKKGIGRFFAKTANFFDGCKTLISCMRHPEQLMDSHLRYAVSYAEECETAVLSRLKNEKLINDLLTD